jgi:hypothetical protein
VSWKAESLRCKSPEAQEGQNNIGHSWEDRLRIKLDELSKKKDEIEIMELKHREEIGTIKKQMNQLMVMVPQNPRLANIKSEVLINKNSC